MAVPSAKVILDIIGQVYSADERWIVLDDCATDSTLTSAVRVRGWWLLQCYPIAKDAA